MSIPNNLRYTKTHEWVRVEGNTAVVGITDHAQQELTDIVYVEPPHAGDNVEAGHQCAVVESVKAASDIYAPVSGEVIAANTELASSPELVNQDAYGHGWLFKVKMSDPPQVDELLTPDEYANHIGE
ncbi:MAG: glycine cleavage system protein GcvH [Verrucomicrobia bacterium]|nr:glycine cleavage system protein GcvH [Verrucomicrobiota bacterium]